MTAPDRFDLIDPEQAFGDFAPAWEELLRSSASDSPFLSPAWLRPWWEAYGAGRTPALIVARRGREPVAIAPLQVTTERYRSRLPARTLRFFGDGTEDSDYLDFIVPRGEEPSVVPAVWAWLRRSSRYGVAQWNEIPESSPTLPIVRALAARDGALLEEDRVGCVVAALPETWEAYIAALKPRMRTKVRSLRRALEQEHRVELAVAGAETLAPTLESLFTLHEKRWATRGETGVFAAPAKRDFYHRMAASFLERGALHLATLLVDGAPVAHQCCLRHGDAAYLLQEGYDPAWEERGVGNVLRAMVIERMIGEGVRAYDFLRGVTSHKLSWGGAEKESVRLTLRGSGPRAALASGITRLVAARARLRTALARGASRDADRSGR
jgi:CelD/BcsL family acetyltransferase involved in cellulose biosynthesis